MQSLLDDKLQTIRVYLKNYERSVFIKKTTNDPSKKKKKKFLLKVKRASIDKIFFLTSLIYGILGCTFSPKILGCIL